MSLPFNILKTKFFLPQPTSDFVERKALNTKLDRLRLRPVMLVSASTGFGKSTVIADFLSKQDENYAWLSLSDKENEFQKFFTYFIKAIQNQIQNFGDEVLELSNAPEPPTVDELAELLVNKIAQLDSLFYLAIDDYHLIRNNDVHLFVAKLFEYTQPFFRLIIITRRDPELPLPEWRSKNKLIEIRSSDLKFNRIEIEEFYEKTISSYPDEVIISKLQEATDGWISGLRMLMLSASNGKEFHPDFVSFNLKNSYVIQELVSAVLNKQTAEIKDKLLRLSLLKEFNAELFSGLCLNEDEKENTEGLFEEFIETITKSNMFIIALDEKHKWYRFHHLFIDQLYDVLKEQYDIKKIDELRGKAAGWFHENGILDDAISYYLKANKFAQALDVFTEYRLELISFTRFQKLEQILDLFPEKFIDKNSILLVTKGWIILQKGNIPEMAKFIEPLDQILKQEGHPQDILDLLIGELHAMKTFDRYLSNVDMQACLKHSLQAIKLLKDKNPYALGIAWVYYGGAMQHLGQPKKAKKEIYAELEKAENPMLRGHLLLILCFLDWFEGNLRGMIKIAEHLLKLGYDSGIKMLIANGNIMAGIAHYYQNNDDSAMNYLLESHELRHYTYLHLSFATGMALAEIYAKTDKLKESDAIIHAYETKALKQGGKLFINITKSTSAELARRYQKDVSGLKWAQENDYKDFLPLTNLFSPEIVQARILALEDDPVSQSLAQDILNLTIPFFEDRNDINVLIRAYTIKAILFYKLGKSEKAFDTLYLVLNLSSVGNYIRPYLQLGESMKNLLLEYNNTSKNSTHIDEILQHFQNEADLQNEVNLTQREIEILVLAEKMTNKEVGNQLFISEKTVKVHITNINKKLQAVSKLESVAKAKELKLI